MNIRTVCHETDVPGIVRVLNACDPADPITVNELLSEFQQTTAGKITMRLVAVDEQDTITGYVYQVHSAEAPAHHFYIWMRVDPALRCQGIGSALWNTALAYLQAQGATRLGSEVLDSDPASLALDGNVWVGFASVSLSPKTQSAYNATTGVIRAYRGRKIGQALKVMAARYARQHGAQTIRTDNDSLNVPILAINRRLGYQPQPGTYLLVRWLKDELSSTIR
jgi:GNAT superfamily N-acetyltransferase